MANDWYTNANTQLSVSPFADIVQSAAINFDGALPEGALTTKNGQYIFATGTHQGMVDPAAMGITTPIRVDRLILVMAGQATWSIDVNLDSTHTYNVTSGTTETSHALEGVAFLLPGQQLKVTTTGGATSSVYMVCSVSDPNRYPIKT